MSSVFSPPLEPDSFWFGMELCPETDRSTEKLARSLDLSVSLRLSVSFSPCLLFTASFSTSLSFFIHISVPLPPSLFCCLSVILSSSHLPALFNLSLSVSDIVTLRPVSLLSFPPPSPVWVSLCLLFFFFFVRISLTPLLHEPSPSLQMKWFTLVSALSPSSVQLQNLRS